MPEDPPLPLDQHFDSGFGATADSFHDAAKALTAGDSETGAVLKGDQLPEFHLFRHANELYLKSILTILHRRFLYSFPTVKADDFPLIDVDGKVTRMSQVHSLPHLFRQYHRLLDDYDSDLSAAATTDWTLVPEELAGMVELINGADESSSMFCYPITLDPRNDGGTMPDVLVALKHLAETLSGIQRGLWNELLNESS